MPFILNARLDQESYDWLAERAEVHGSMSAAVRQAVAMARMAIISANHQVPVPDTEEAADAFAALDGS